MLKDDRYSDKWEGDLDMVKSAKHETRNNYLKMESSTGTSLTINTSTSLSGRKVLPLRVLKTIYS